MNELNEKKKEKKYKMKLNKSLINIQFIKDSVSMEIDPNSLLLVN